MKVGDLVAYNGADVNAVGKIVDAPEQWRRDKPESVYVQLLNVVISDTVAEPRRSNYRGVMRFRTSVLRLINSDSELAMLRLKGIA